MGFPWNQGVVHSLYLIAYELNAFSGQNTVPGRVRNIRTNETVLAHQEDAYTAFVVHKSDHLPQRSVMSSIKEVFNKGWGWKRETALLISALGQGFTAYGFGAEPEELPDSWVPSHPQLTPSVHTFVNELERVDWTTQG